MTTFPPYSGILGTVPLGDIELAQVPSQSLIVTPAFVSTSVQVLGSVRSFEAVNSNEWSP